jgi:hypothetical protein
MSPKAAKKAGGPKRTTCKKCKSKRDGDWIKCDQCPDWYHKECTDLSDETYAALDGEKKSIWLCCECLPFLTRFLPKAASCSCASVNAAVDAVMSTVVKKIDNVCKERDSAVASHQQSISQYQSNMRILEKKISEMMEVASSKILPPTEPVGPPQNSPDDISNTTEKAGRRANEEADRDANRDRLIITNMPVVPDAYLPDAIIGLGWSIGLELRYSDIENCNQLAGAHPSNARPVFVKFVSKCMRDTFYARYRRLVLRHPLCVADVYTHLKGDHRRIYVAEHLTPADNTIFKEARRMKKRNIIGGAYTKYGQVHIIPLGSTCGQPIHDLSDLAMLEPIQSTPAEQSDNSFASCHDQSF